MALQPGSEVTCDDCSAGCARYHDPAPSGRRSPCPRFFGSSALYPVDLMPGWLRAFNDVNPLGYEVDGLRGLLIGVPAQLGLDFGVLIAASVVMIGIASALLIRLVH
jgi:ABC-2 type transport system permease protein